MKFVKFLDSIQAADAEAEALICDAPEGTEFEVKRVSNRRTAQQNRALWLYCTRLAEALTVAGFDQRTYPFREGLTIPFTKHSVMEIFWRPVQLALTEKESTTDLETTEVSGIYEVLDRAMSERTGVHVEFPHA